jgi:hypothetical protein
MHVPLRTGQAFAVPARLVGSGLDLGCGEAVHHVFLLRRYVWD